MNTKPSPRSVEEELCQLLATKAKRFLRKRGRSLVPEVVLYVPDPYRFRGIMGSQVKRDRNGGRYLSWYGCDAANSVTKQIPVKIV